MTICDPLHCPFLGCASCEFAGGVDPSATTVLPVDNSAGGVGSNGHTGVNEPPRQGATNAP